MEKIQAYLAANPNMAGLVVALLGAFLFVGTLLKWEWVISPNRKFSLLRAIIGPRGEMFVVSTVIFLGGMTLFILL